MAFIAYHFHWPHGEVMNLEHKERRRWCEEISAVNRQLNSDSKQKSTSQTLESIM